MTRSAWLPRRLSDAASRPAAPHAWYLATPPATTSSCTPFAVAVDSGGGTGRADVYVGSWRRHRLPHHRLSTRRICTTGVNAITHVNASATPFVTVTPPVKPDGIAVDSGQPHVYVGTGDQRPSLSEFSTHDRRRSSRSSMGTVAADAGRPRLHPTATRRRRCSSRQHQRPHPVVRRRRVDAVINFRLGADQQGGRHRRLQLNGFEKEHRMRAVGMRKRNWFKAAGVVTFAAQLLGGAGLASAQTRLFPHADVRLRGRSGLQSSPGNIAHWTGSAGYGWNYGSVSGVVVRDGARQQHRHANAAPARSITKWLLLSFMSSVPMPQVDRHRRHARRLQLQLQRIGRRPGGRQPDHHRSTSTTAARVERGARAARRARARQCADLRQRSGEGSRRRGRASSRPSVQLLQKHDHHGSATRRGWTTGGDATRGSEPHAASGSSDATHRRSTTGVCRWRCRCAPPSTIRVGPRLVDLAVGLPRRRRVRARRLDGKTFRRSGPT